MTAIRSLLAAVALVAAPVVMQAQQGSWVTVPVGGAVSVQFPVKPDSVSPGDGVTVFRVRLPDSTATLSVQVRDLSGSGVSAATLVEASASDEFWTGTIQGLVQQLGATLRDSKRTTLAGLPAMTATVDRMQDGKPSVMYIQFALGGTYTYLQVFNERDPKASAAMRSTFLSSIAAKAP